MNILLFDDDDVDPQHSDQLRLSDRRAVHIREILKLAVGDKIRIGRIGGKTGFGELVTTGKEEVRILVGKLENEPPLPSPVELILALPRPKSLKRTLRAVANLGIKSVHLIHASRVEKPYWSAPVLEPTAMREAMLDGLSIARDTIVPSVRLHRLFKPFIQDFAPHLVDEIAYVAHPRLSMDSQDRLCKFSAPTIPVAIGPEGGFSDYEIALFHDAGFETLNLGDRIFSAECVVPVIDSVIRMRKLRDLEANFS